MVLTSFCIAYIYHYTIFNDVLICCRSVYFKKDYVKQGFGYVISLICCRSVYFRKDYVK